MAEGDGERAIDAGKREKKEIMKEKKKITKLRMCLRCTGRGVVRTRPDTVPGITWFLTPPQSPGLISRHKSVKRFSSILRLYFDRTRKDGRDVEEGIIFVVQTRNY